MKLVATLWGAYECRPPLTVGKHRTYNFAPDGRTHVGVFVKDNAVEIGTSKSVWVIRTVDAYPGPVDQLHPKLGLVLVGKSWPRKSFQIFPGDFLSLGQVRRDVGVPTRPPT